MTARKDGHLQISGSVEIVDTSRAQTVATVHALETPNGMTAAEGQGSRSNDRPAVLRVKRGRAWSAAY